MVLYDHIYRSGDISLQSSYNPYADDTHVEHDAETSGPPFETRPSS